MAEKDGEQLDQLREKRSSIAWVKEEKNILHTIKTRKADWICHILHRNCL